MAGFGLLIDGFDDGVRDPALWSQSYGDPVEQNGMAAVPCTTGYAAYRSASAYTLTWSQVAARVYPPAAGGASTAACSLLVLSSTPGTDAGFLIDAAQGAMGLYLREGYGDGAALFPTYDPVAHAWLRLREDGGSLHWEASSDGRTWSLLRTAATPAWAAHADLSLLFEAHRDTGTPDYARLDNLNVTRPGRCGPTVRTVPGLHPLPRAAPLLKGG